MRRCLLAFILIPLAGCSRGFATKADAVKACEDWSKKGEIYEIKILTSKNNNIKVERWSRSCSPDLIENQVLGFERNIKKGIAYDSSLGITPPEKPVKPFVYKSF